MTIPRRAIFAFFVAMLLLGILAIADAQRIASVTVSFDDGTTQVLQMASAATSPATMPATQSVTQPTTSPTTQAVRLPAGWVGCQVIKSNVAYGPFSFIGGYQGLLIQGGVKNVTIDGFTSIDASGYGLYEGMSGGLNDSLVYRNVVIEMPTKGEHCERIYGARNRRESHTRLVNYGKVFAGSTLALKEAQGCVWEDLYTEGIGPKLGPLPLASEVTHRVSKIRFVNYNGVLDGTTPQACSSSYLQIGSGCSDIVFTPYERQRGSLRQKVAGVPVMVFSDINPALRKVMPNAPMIPPPTGISFTNYDFFAPPGSALLAGDASGCEFVNCTYNGSAIGLHGGAN